MKKLVTMMMALMLAFTMTACGGKAKSSSAEQPAGDALARIKAAGKMVIATEGTWAPYTFVDENGKLTGYDVEVARAVAEKLGVEAEFVTGDFDGFLIGLDNGIYDMVFNCIDITPSREEKYDFSEAYINTTVVLIVKDDNDTIKTFDDLAGKTTTNTITSSFAATAEEYGATVIGATTFEETIQLVLQGRADATLNSQGSYDDYMKVHPDTALKLVDSYTTYAGAPMKKGEDAATLRAAVNEALAALKADGTLTRLSLEFFGEDFSGSNN